MAANPVREKRDLLFILGQADPANLIVRNAITGTVVVVGIGPNPTDRANVSIPAKDISGVAKQVNLLEFAPIAWWRDSPTLLNAVESGWLLVDVDGPVPAPTEEAQPSASLFDLFIARPPNAQEGDLITYDISAGSWVRLPVGPSGWILGSNGPGSQPSYKDPASIIPVTTNLAMATNEATDSATFIAAGAFPLDGSDYSTIRMLSVASVTSGGLTGEVQLYNLTDAIVVPGGTNTYAGITAPTDLITGALALDPTPKLYELRFRVTGGTPPADRINLAYAGLELIT